MGVNIKDIVTPIKINFDELKNKTIAIDAYNAIYQFLSIIRQFDGKPLVDRKGFITSHLSGLFYRTINLLENGLKPIYVFDGEPPRLKSEVLAERTEIREKSKIKWEAALERREWEEARKYAKASSRLSKDMVFEAKKLISLMGIPLIQAPSEGEAQAAYMTIKGDVWACGSQDWDSLLFGCSKLVRNLTITGRRKIPKKETYVQIEPEIIYLDKILRDNGISRDQLIDLSILVGTDYNKGVKGVGSKTALKLIKKHGSLEKIIEAEKFVYDFNIDETRSLFLKPKVEQNYEILWVKPDYGKIVDLLHSQHDFSIDRINKALQRLNDLEKDRKRPTLDNWFNRKN